MVKNIILSILTLTLLLPTFAFAQNSFDQYISADVLEVIETTYPLVFRQEIEFQRLEARLETGEVIDTVFNDYTPVSAGDTVYLTLGYDPDTEQEGYFVREIDRINTVFFMVLFFIVVYIAITGMIGIRSLFALGISMLAIFFVLLPLIIAGYPPLLVSLLVSAVILGIAIFVTHGISILSLSSYLGSLLAICVALLFALFIHAVGNISGLVGDEASTLIVLYGSSIDVAELILATMIIGILGVLDDVSVVQAGVVRELIRTESLSTKETFTRALNVGREHAASLVNTLVLAYVSVSLPLLLILNAPGGTQIPTPLRMDISNELFVIELIRSITGSLGLVIAIPLVTWIALVLYKRFPPHGEMKGHVHIH